MAREPVIQKVLGMKVSAKKVSVERIKTKSRTSDSQP